MRLLEVLVFLGAAGYSLGLGLRYREVRRARRGELAGWIIPPGVLLGLGLTHLLLEGLRWPLIPMYTAGILLTVTGILILIFGLLKRLLPQLLIRSFGWTSLGLALIGLVLGVVVPVERMPEPTGPHEVGTLVFEVTDSNRREPYGSAPQGLRRIRVQAWYPAAGVSGYPRAAWLEDGPVVAPAVSRSMEFPEFLLGYAALARSNAFWNAPVLESPEDGASGLPLVIISHGWTGFKNLHGDIAEDIASRGGVVMALDHSFASAGTVFDDGQRVLLDPEILPERGEPDFIPAARRLIYTFSEDIRLLLDVLVAETGGGDRPSPGVVRVSDGSLPVPPPPRQNRGEPAPGEIPVQVFDELLEALDLSRVGLIGHSTGAGAVVQTALEDSRFRGIVGLDPWVEPLDADFLRQGLSVPALIFRSQSWQGHPNDAHLEVLASHAQSPLGLFQIRGSTHNDFTMAYMFGPVGRMLGMLGPVGATTMQSVLRESVSGFFDALCRGEDRGVQLFQAAAGFPMVEAAGF
ncbi:alpha/beta hydrolase [Spirochaeta lutea]|uniref:Uncharacterized protein n=1 Tax=Spirochaeta lutea TaxID=1480694 RepID=A0A098QVJ3_9SPIO|nr:hypothetical protein [Spirochaeta lutea]KGE71749.1 hypothetical protein DC28_10945 [Spirochaeta lutea]